MKFLILFLLLHVQINGEPECFDKVEPKEPGTIPPVIIFPGLMSSSLLGRPIKRNGTIYEDENNIIIDAEDEGWRVVWGSMIDIFGRPQSVIDAMKLRYDRKQGRSFNGTYEITTIGWGSTEGIEYINYRSGFGVPFAKVAATLVRVLVQEGGYVKNVTLFGAPYDWRIAGNDPAQSYLWEKFDRLVEYAYERSKGRKVVLYSHCMGSSLLAEHLATKHKWWKRKYIDTFVSVVGSYRGSIYALQAILSGGDDGYNFLGKPLIPVHIIREFARTSTAIASLIPHTPTPSDDVIVWTPKNNYTANYHSIRKALQEANAWDSLHMYTHVIPQPSVRGKAPGVRVVCHFTHGNKTPIGVKYDEELSDHMKSSGKLLYGDGDGDLPSSTVDHCLRWREMQVEPVEVYEWEGIDHVGSIRKPDIARHVLNNVLQKPPSAR